MDAPWNNLRWDADLIETDGGVTVRLDDGSGSTCLLRHVSAGVRACLAALDRGRPWSEARRLVPAEEEFAVRRLVHELLEAGLARRSPAPRPAEVCLIGGGATARRLARELLGVPAVRLTVIAPEPSPFGGLADQPTDAACALRAGLVQNDPGNQARIRCDASWATLTEGGFDLVVVTPASIQPDRSITAHLIRHSLPFLPVLVHRGWLRIGPLADYEGACLHCCDLTLADADPGWPEAVEQLSRQPARPDAGLSRLAASLAGRYAAWFLAGDGNALRSLTLEASLTTPGLAWRSWPSHPDCACSWEPLADTVAA